MKPYSDGMADDAPDRLVLTEQEYNDYTDDSLGFGTSAALQALRENVCVFVGCSMKDELMRRALRRWYRERIRSIAEEHPESEPYDVEKRWKRHFAVMERSIPKMEQAIHTDLDLSGVYPLWVDNFDVDLVQRLTHLEVFLERMSQCDVDERGEVRNGQI
jgi:hypothetical protein